MKTNYNYKHVIKRCNLIIVFLLIMTPLLALIANEGDWKLERNKNNIKVYTRQVQGSQLKEFKAMTTITGSTDNLVALLKDFDSYHLWIDNYKQAKELKKVSNDEFYYYLEIATPWPVNNRDIIIHFKFEKDSDGKSIIGRMTGKPEYSEKKEGLVRMPKFNGFWKFTPKENGKVEVICQVHAEPGGSVPDWLANSMMTDGPFNTMTMISEWANKPKYNINK